MSDATDLPGAGRVPPVPSSLTLGALERLSGRGDSWLLRAFALACATRLVDAHAEEAVVELLVRGYDMALDPEAGERARAKYRGAAQGAGVVGLRRGLPSAVRFLAAYYALDPDAHGAARRAAEMELRHAFLTGADVARVHQRQADWLAYLFAN